MANLDLGFTTYASATAPPARPHDATQTTLESSRNPAPPGPVTFTASVTDPAIRARVPTGWVIFRVDDNGNTVSQPHARDASWSG